MSSIILVLTSITSTEYVALLFVGMMMLTCNFYQLGNFVILDGSCWLANYLLLFTRPLPRDGGMAKDHGAPEAEQLPRVWTRGRRETESCQRVSGAKSL